MIAYYDLNEKIQFAQSVDVGHQKKPESKRAVERFLDSRQIAVSTSTPNGFQVTGASMNLDYHYDPALMIRSEIKLLKSLDPIFETVGGKTRIDRLVVVSLSLRI